MIFDVDPTFNNTNEWWESIPEDSRPRKDQPFYHLLAENETSYYVAYVSEQNLVSDNRATRSTTRRSRHVRRAARGRTLRPRRPPALIGAAYQP